MTRDEFEKHVAEVLLKKGYRFTNESHVEAFDPDPDDQAIVHMYEVLSMYDYLTTGEERS